MNKPAAIWQPVFCKKNENVLYHFPLYPLTQQLLKREYCLGGENYGETGHGTS